jgi:hypothetical protein
MQFPLSSCSSQLYQVHQLLALHGAWKIHIRIILEKKGLYCSSLFKSQDLKLKSIAYSTFINSELKWLIVIVTLLKEDSPILQLSDKFH